MGIASLQPNAIVVYTSGMSISIHHHTQHEYLSLQTKINSPQVCWIIIAPTTPQPALSLQPIIHMTDMDDGVTWFAFWVQNINNNEQENLY